MGSALPNISSPTPESVVASVVYGDANVTDLAIYTVGDGAAMSGLLVAGRCKTGEATFLILLD